MTLIRYKPGEAIRWLETGAEDLRKSAKKQGGRVLARQGDRDVKNDIKDVAGALFGFGKSALAELLHRQLEASEYILSDDKLEVVGPTGSRYATYKEIQGINLKGDRAVVLLERGKITIKPHAYIVSGSIKVPIGWSRNGMEVAYEMLLDELAARAGVNLERL